jgi:hypothetical protein
VPVKNRRLVLKNIPDEIEGSKGPWYKLISEMIGSVTIGMSLDELISILGEADIRVDKIDDEFYESKTNMVFDIFGDNSPDFILIYIDPFRRTREYHYEIKNNKIEFMSKISVDIPLKL